MLEPMGWGAALAAFAAGLVSFFSPCVAPLVPGYIGYLSGAAPAVQPSGAVQASGAVALDGRSAAGSRTAATRATLLFVGGFSATFMLLGLATASVGRLVVAYRPVLETLAGIVMLAMGAFLLGLLPRPVMLALLGERRIHLPRSAARRLRSAGPFALGVVFGAGWTPCIGPVLAAILVYVGAAADRGAGLALLALYSLGFAIPFIAVGLGWSQSVRALGWAKRHARAISVVSGVALVAVGLLYLAGQGQLFAVWAQHLAGSAPR